MSSIINRRDSGADKASRMQTVMKAGDLRVGTQIAEQDGFLLEVVEIVAQTHKTITVRLCSDFSSNKNFWTVKPDGAPGGVLITFGKDSVLFGIIPP